jgi:peptide/nickel transport system substrate-binding protein
VDQSKGETDPAKRKALFEQVDKGFKDMAPPLIVFLQRTDPYAIRKNVSGYVGHPTWSTRWAGVTKK